MIKHTDRAGVAQLDRVAIGISKKKKKSTSLHVSYRNAV